MIDTLGIGIAVDPLDLSALRRRGWVVMTKEQTRDGAMASDTWATIQTVEGVRCSYMPGISWVSLESSLPALVDGGDNARILTWAECWQGMESMRAIASEALDHSLPPFDEGALWRIARVDPVHAWSTDPAPYLAALNLARLPRAESKQYAGSLSWVSMRSRRILARAYDKAAEAGHDVDAPMRLERQVRKPARLVARDDNGQRVSNHLDGWTAETAPSLVTATMRDLGLDKPVPSPMGARVALVGAHGRRKGQNTWRALLDASTSGGWEYVDASRETVLKYQRRARQAGVVGVSLAGELPALTVPLSALQVARGRKVCTLRSEGGQG